VALALAGCAGGKAGQTGFLKDYSQLKPDPGVDGALRYVNPKVFTYRQFIVDRVAVYFAPNAKGTGIDPEKLTVLTKYFRDGLTKALAKNYKVVKRKGRGVARIRLAITDVEETDPLLNIHPAMKLTGAGLGGASMEGELVDSMSGQRLGAIVETRSGSRLSMGAGLNRLGHAKQVIDYWIKRFVGNLDKAQGKSG
jgi:hypothetical protein